MIARRNRSSGTKPGGPELFAARVVGSGEPEIAR